MEPTLVQQDDVLKVLTTYPNGISSDALWAECSTKFDDRHDFAIALHRMVQQLLIYKQSGLYLKVGNVLTADSVLPSARKSVKRPQMLKAAVPKPAVVPSAVAEVEKNLKQGALQRTRSTGAIALALYQCFNERPLTLDDLVSFTGVTRKSAYTSTVRLVLEGYINRDKSGKHALFKWAGNHTYPFPSHLPRDSGMLLLTAASWRAKTIGHSPVVAAEDPVDAKAELTDTHSHTLIYIDTQIDVYESRLKVLHHMREIIMKPTV